jgi:hypothetical protein
MKIRNGLSSDMDYTGIGLCRFYFTPDDWLSHLQAFKNTMTNQKVLHRCSKVFDTLICLSAFFPLKHQTLFAFSLN